MQDFSYIAYLKLIKTIKDVIPLVDFSHIKDTDEKFFILRHDVEFSVEKAYELARIEHDILNITSSYFFQLRNYTYNPLAENNANLIKKIAAMGHKIGLHVHGYGDHGYPNNASSMNEISTFIKNEVNLLQNGLGIPVDRFSFHRPSHHVLQLNIHIDRLINTYDKKFFHFCENDNMPESLNVYYFSDSEHKWKYGDPLSILEKPIKKIQLLTHPYSWSKQGLNNIDNFNELIALKQKAMLKAMNNECRHFPNELLLYNANENI